ncbi:hypothetical protein GCM10027521_18910 [Amycolatopsis cihanbeyliensis]
MKRGLSVGAVVVVTCGVVPAAAIAEPEAASSDDAVACAAAQKSRVSTVEDARSLHTPVVTSGTVFREGGKEPAGDVPVHLMAWPSDEMANVGDGGQFQLTPIGRTTTGSDGGYQMRVDPSVPLDGLAGEGGLVEVSLDVQTPDGMASHVASMSPDQASPSRAKGAEERATKATMPKQLDLELERPSGEAAAARSKAAGPNDSLAVQGQDLGAKWTNVGSLFIEATGVWGQVHHTTSADNSLGAGISYGNGYSASGTVYREASTTVGFGRHGR